jgi:peptidoglycan/xylan/chitin deacetylase (PgdA/CDA1 family)
MRALVLAYHSLNVAGNEYGDNDHVAFAEDLRLLTQARARIVGLDLILGALREGAIDDSTRERPLVALTFDDGPVFDVVDFTHPWHGRQRSFLNTMLDFAASHGQLQPHLGATSFVIASREARAALQAASDRDFPDLGHWLSDSWWPMATGRSLLRLGNHSWDHVHPVMRQIAAESDERENFAVVDNYVDATSEIREAGRFIEGIAGEPCRYFAYPYGHTNRYLVSTYFPVHQAEHGTVAAFTTEGRRIAAIDSLWALPRAVCGAHWHDGGGLMNLLYR